MLQFVLLVAGCLAASLTATLRISDLHNHLLMVGRTSSGYFAQHVNRPLMNESLTKHKGCVAQLQGEAGSHETAVDVTGIFSFDVEPGKYILSVRCPLLEYPRNSVLITHSGDPKITLMDFADRAVGDLSNPPILVPLGAVSTNVHPDPSVSLLGLLKNPMVIGGLVVLFFMFGMPFIWNQMDEEDIQAISQQRQEASYAHCFTPLKTP
ncbi:MAG: hypothetical protein KVP17_002346 [Porospora cf. gigantea B]|uniref:uncharacterized protein n=1 Tax=Porospora cf. gigantea B TaxID=2853592 RepID=UPI003571BEF0|nr:MAG: hypothetical protein KVP17_002346 [Porospora cf. gigantea B]